MDYAKAIRIARALVDMSQRELAKRVSVDASLISMIESGKRKPSVETLENISEALGLPFHLFALLGAEPRDGTSKNATEIEQLGVALTKLLLGEREIEPKIVDKRRDKEIKYSKSKPPSPNSRRRHRKAG
jgi:transcriptional regulator with XRE-family HTH domain